MTNPSIATQPEDRCTNLNATKTPMFFLYSKKTSWKTKQNETKQLITYKTPKQSVKSVVVRDFDFLLWDRDSGFSTLKNKNETSKPTNQPKKKTTSPISLTGDVSFNMPLPIFVQNT